MAGRAGAGSSSRLPGDQLREKEKDGRIKRFLWDVLTLRMVAYVCAQPASFSFIVSFLFITLSLPPMAAYIKNSQELPDLDTMRSWNAYLGRLHSLGLCVEAENISLNLSAPLHPVASVFIDFQVDSSAVHPGVDILVGHFSGKDLHTKIKSSDTGERVDHLVNVSIYLPLPLNYLNDSDGNDDMCSPTCQGCVDISAPNLATPSRHPQIPGVDFTFKTRVLGSVNHPVQPDFDQSCAEYYKSRMEESEEEEDEEKTVLAQILRLGDECKQILPQKERYRKHGLINIYLTQEQKVESYKRMLLGTLGVAVIGLAFAFSIGCTERPPKPKNRPD